MTSYGLFLFSIKKKMNVYSIPYFLLCGRARFQVTTKDSVFAFKVWMFESKDRVLEMSTAKHHVRIELLNVWKKRLNIWRDEQDYEIRQPDVSIVEQQVWPKRLRVRIEELSVWIGEYSVCIAADQLLQNEALHVSVDKRPV